MQLKVDKNYVGRLCEAIIEDVNKMQAEEMEKLIKEKMSGFLKARTREDAIKRIKDDRWFVPVLQIAKVKAEKIVQSIALADKSGKAAYDVKLDDSEASWLWKWATDLKFERYVFPPELIRDGS